MEGKFGISPISIALPFQRQITDLQGQIERLTLDLHHANEARERAEDEAEMWKREAWETLNRATGILPYDEWAKRRAGNP